MNDEFLYRLREEPPREFALELKARLDRAAALRRGRRARYLHGFGVALLLGGAAYALTSGTLREWWRGGVEVPSDRAVVSSPAAAPLSTDASAPAPFAQQPKPVAEPAAQAADAATADDAGRARTRAAEPNGGGPTQQDVDQRRGGIPRNVPTIIGTPGTEPHTDAAVGFFERYRFAAPSIEVHDDAAALARFCDPSFSVRVHVLVTFTRMGPDAPGYCAADTLRGMYIAYVRPIELVAGYEATVLARSILYGAVELPALAVFLALARDVPEPRGAPAIVRNPYRAWYEIDPQLAYDRIELVGPSLDTPQAASALALLMNPGCRALLRSLQPAAPSPLEDTRSDIDLCRAVRADGVYDAISSSEETVRRLETQPNVFGVLSADTYARHAAKLAAVAIDGVAPTGDAYANGAYPAARTLYVYVNPALAAGTPGVKELVETYLQLPQIARVLVAPDDAMQHEMRVRVAKLGGNR